MNRQPMLAQLRRAHLFGCSDLAWQAGVSEDVVVRMRLAAPVPRQAAELILVACFDERASPGPWSKSG